MPKRSTPPLPPDRRLAEAALKRLARTRWETLTLAATAKAAKIALPELMGLCTSKARLLELILAHVGAVTTATYVPEPGNAHDRLFEAAMSWFEVLGTHKKAVARLTDGLKRDPLTLVAARAGIVAAANWLLVLAEADTGRALPARALALAWVLGRTVPVWLEDDGDLSKTMARLDAGIRRIDQIAARLGG